MILCCGEALIDMLPRTSVDGEQAFAPYAGGAVFNTAIALGRLGAPSGYLGGLSEDLFGQILADALSASKVDFSLCPRSPRPTTLAFVTLTDGQARYAFYDENTAGRMLTESDLPMLGDETQALFFGGISLVSEPQADSYAALCAAAGDRVVMIDPNIRPGFITDEARYRSRLAGMLTRADIIKISDEDMEWLGTDAASLLSGETRVVLVTRGAEGVDVVTARGTKRVPARRVEVVDTVGAGDTFNAGFLSGLHQAGLLTRAALAEATEEALSLAADLGARAAAVTVSRAGANPPWDTEL
ncbi:carbohydrate kinase family protein [Mameliella sediminis]|uniref:carbohydrate kinase family protein n=1 Tax=Mameliella sediminis TaxID=2836866 RepID=UPI001C442DB5|nr:carbohydrate kinase [Mameliella sediminis]MBY6113602.1 carbohydrate kinase [Antarctobacter heliothermus]MBY6143050.1 carbohydrate kinase [Mameliella alba]MBV7394900.1 carbohydrate kinase [Mameliella sediminis]MBY6159905.1 carbohydrate kinase [Mameliella alba]MBY6168376.1 carbohydrate kinase [Mameliella alba]